MKILEIGISEFQARVSHYINMAKYNGVILIITSHGTPKAILRGFVPADMPLRLETIDDRDDLTVG